MTSIKAIIMLNGNPSIDTESVGVNGFCFDFSAAFKQLHVEYLWANNTIPYCECQRVDSMYVHRIYHTNILKHCSEGAKESSCERD